MASVDIARRRVVAQRVTGEPCEDAAQAVSALGAVQAQDYLGSLWAIGLRTRGAVEADVERAIAERSIVRTWPMRGTLHVVAAADVRWMLKLLAARPMAAAAARHRQLGLDGAMFARSRDALARALRGAKRLTRDAAYRVLAAARVPTEGQRGIHVLQQLSHEGLLCHAAREGKQQTFALLDEWVPPARAVGREEALERLAHRYFTGHGPATLEDLAWWSGLAAADAREALELAKPRLRREVVGGTIYYRSREAPRGRRGRAPGARLLPAFDELLVGYRDRSATLDPSFADRVHHLLSPTVVVDGRVVGTWTRTIGKDAVVVTASFFERRPPRAWAHALEAAAEEYGRFVGRRAVLR